MVKYFELRLIFMAAAFHRIFIQHTQCVSAENKASLLICERNFRKSVQLVLIAPHRVIGSPHNMVNSDFSDKLCCVFRRHRIKGAGAIGVNSAVGKQLCTLVPFRPACKMCSDYYQLRKTLYYLQQPFRRRITALIKKQREQSHGGLLRKEN